MDRLPALKSNKTENTLMGSLHDGAIDGLIQLTHKPLGDWNKILHK